MSIAGELSILGTTKSVQRQHLERLYPYIDWSKMPFSSYDDFFALKSILDDCGAVWTNAYGRSNSEDASTRDILPDYSGNGRDIRLYNFGFAGMSGFGGGFAIDNQCAKCFASRYIALRSGSSVDIERVGEYKFLQKEAGRAIYSAVDVNGQVNTGQYIFPSYKVKITNIGNAQVTVRQYCGTNFTEYIDILCKEGINTVPNTEVNLPDAIFPSYQTVVWVIVDGEVPSDGIYIEFLSEYQGALVSDGIDDYGQCVKDFVLPDDYTVVTIRQKLGGNSVLAGKSRDSKNGAFLFEYNNLTYNYGVSTSVTGSVPALFSYQTKTSYNGVELNVGDGTDTEEDKFMLFMMRPNADKWSSYALYDLRIFTRTLTDEELRVVKNCMMAEWAAMTGELDNITYVADWDGKDRSNDEEEPTRSQWVDKKTGKVINLNNFGFAGMSGWGGYLFDWSSGWKTDYADLIDTKEYGQTKVKFAGFENVQSSYITLLYNANVNFPAGTKIRVRISGLKETERFVLVDNNNPSIRVNRVGDGILEYSIGSPLTYPRLSIDLSDKVNREITIEQLPLYPGALVSDGVDDYGQTAEAISDEVGTVLVYGDYLTTNIQYLLSCGLATEDTWLYATQEDNNGVSRVGKPDKTVTDTMPMASLTRDPASPNAKMRLFNAGDSNYACAWLSRLILIREQLDAAQVEFLKWKVDKEHRDWLIRMGLYEEEIPWYGIEFDTTDPSPDVKRIGNMEMHRTLPVQSQMRGCLLNDDGTVAKYLDAADWTSETRDGSAGQVMVEMPKDAYWRFETWGTKRRVKFATMALPGFTRTPQGYDSAYEASVQRSASKLCSVVNTDADYRGGNNSPDRDGTYRSQLGLPATAISRTNFRTYARNRNADSSEWNCMTYDFQKLVYWLFAVEYATLNTQKTFNAEKDADGLSQGGLGNGVTTVNYNRWSNFNGVYPFIPCGHTDSLGNGTGQIQFTMPFEYDASPSSSTGLGNNYVGEYLSDTAYTSGQFVSQGEDLYECISDTEAGTPLTDTIHFSKVTRTAVQVPRYRGLENPFGHIWQWTDGINVRISPDSDNGGDGLSKVFVTDNPEYFNDSNYDNMSYIGNEARSEGYIKEIIFGEGGEIMPSVVGGSSTTYFCDYHYRNIPTTETLRGVLFGGLAAVGTPAGLVCANSSNAPSAANATFGSRLCFIPEKA